MLKIDNSLLEEIGLGSLPDGEKNSLLRHIYETLEMRVGMRLADQMTNEQLDEFEQYFEAKDDAGAFKWLETNFPNYKDIVQEEFDKLKAEVRQSAPQILAASQQTPTAAPSPQPMPGSIPPSPAMPQPPVQPAPPTGPQPAPTPGYAPPAAPAPAQPYAAPPTPPSPPQPPVQPWTPNNQPAAQPPAAPTDYPPQPPAGPGPQPPQQ